MADTATALLALWNDVAADLDDGYNEWHAKEHVPERLTVPGMLWGLRYRRMGDGAMPLYLTLYGLRDLAVLDSEPYQRLLQHPTPASRQMRPALQNISRWVCRLIELANIDLADRLSVFTFDRQVVDAGVLTRFPDVGSPGRLIAERVVEARALPWLQQDQAGQVGGNLLVCVGGDPDQAPDAPGRVANGRYQRLRNE